MTPLAVATDPMADPLVGTLIAIPVLLPLLAAGLSLMLASLGNAQRVLSVAVLAAVLADAVALLLTVDRDGAAAVRMGAHHPPAGIVLVADRMAALLLVVSIAVMLAVLLYAIGQRVTDYGPRETTTSFHPVYLVLGAGVALAYLTGDLFTLFVAFEIIYVLITRGLTAERARPAMTYVIVSLTSSLLFITLLALVYAATGTVNLADLADRTADLEPGVRTVLALLTVMVFGIKAAIVPLHFWLPDSYPTAPAPVTAVFAALLTKVAVYAILRTQTAVFTEVDIGGVLLALAALTMIVGVLGAIAQDDVHRMMSFLLVSHIGFMMFGLAVLSDVSMTGTVLYIVHHIVVQATLFLVLGLITRHTGTASLAEMRGVATARPGLGMLFAVAALSLAAMPPMSGFLAKITLLRGGIADGSVPAYLGVAALTVASFLTLYALARMWVVAFWGAAGRATTAHEPEPGRSGRVMTAASGGLAAMSVLFAVLAGPLSELSGRAASELLEPTRYSSTVLGGDDG